jgi:hypothetical protein
MIPAHDSPPYDKGHKRQRQTKSKTLLGREEIRKQEFS